jgi:predicted protein tyrosine phosphatase
MIRYCHNISMDSAKRGFWVNVQQENAIYIQITDPRCAFEPAMNSFREIHRFEFLDDEYEGDGHEFSITDEQAEELANILRRANDEQRHVIVSCHAGLCRSGAVTEVMSRAFGYEPGPSVRSPNQLVVKKVMRALGHEFTPETSAFNDISLDILTSQEINFLTISTR